MASDDALYLASALFLRQSFPDLVTLTADERVRTNAALLGLSAEVPPRALRVCARSAAAG